MRSFVLAVIVIFGAWVSTSATADAASKIALVVGNSSYREGALPAPVGMSSSGPPVLVNSDQDAILIARTLRGLGYEIFNPLVPDSTLNSSDLPVIDAGSEQLKYVLKEFGKKSKNYDYAIVYYSGHGLKIGGRQYIVPIDGDWNSYGQTYISIKSLVSSINSKSFQLLMLDACRTAVDDPMTPGGSMTLDSLKPDVLDPEGRLSVIYAAQSGSPSYPVGGTPLTNSPFANSLSQRMRMPGSSVLTILHGLWDDVPKWTRDRSPTQRPDFVGRLSEVVYFTPPESEDLRSTEALIAIDLKIYRPRFGIDSTPALLAEVLGRTSFRQLLNAARAGDVDAAYLVAVAYDVGAGVRPDKVEFARWSDFIAQKGTPAGIYLRGYGLITGRRPGPPDHVTGLVLLERAHAMGFAKADVLLGRAYFDGTLIQRSGRANLVDRQKGLAFWEAGAALGQREALYDLGRAIFEGRQGLPADEARGIELLLKASDLESGEASAMLCFIFNSRGQYAEALAHCEVAARLDNRPAARMIGESYLRGDALTGGSKDFDKALTYLERATRIDVNCLAPNAAPCLEPADLRAFGLLAEMYESGLGRARDLTIARKLRKLQSGRN